MGVYRWEATQYRDLATGNVLDRYVPPPAPTRLMGVYHGAPNEGPDAKTLADFGAYPQIASTYYQPDNPGLNMSYETGRIGRGTSPLITLTFKWGSVSVVDVANQTGPAEAMLTTYINALKTLSELDPDVPVYATIEHEAEVKLNQGEYENTVPTLPQLGAAISRFIARCRAEAPLVRTCYWYGGADTAKIGTILNNLTAAPHVICMDPYRTASHAHTSPIESTLGSKVTWIRANANFVRLGSPELGIAETGTETGTFGHGDANNAAWWGSLRSCMDQFDLRFVVFFNRAGLPAWDVRLLSDRDPLAKAAFTAQMTP